MLTLGELNILEKSRSVHSLHACVIMVALKIYHIGSKTRGYTLLDLRVKSTLRYTDGDWFYKCMFTLPTPSVRKIVTPIIFSISYEISRLPSAKVPQDYQLLTFWCLIEKLTRNSRPFLDARGQLIQSIRAMPMGAWLHFLKSSFQINMLTLGELNILEKSRNVHSLHACMIMVCFKNLSYRAFYVAK